MRKQISDASHLAVFEASPSFEKIMDFICYYSQVIKGVSFSQFSYPEPPKGCQALVNLLELSEKLIEDVPLEAECSQRYGNLAFRTYLSRLEPMVLRWIKENCLDEELLVYYMESLGSKDRLDYGTGHELSFVGFLLVCEALQCWHRTDSPELLEENDPRMKECRFVILIIFRTYLQLIRRLQKRFRLEPAGSHGVWGLDDHQFLPYIFGSAQLIGHDDIPTDSIVDKDAAARMSCQYLYMEAIAYINEIKSGPFHEHSTMLYNISGIPTWQRIHEGLVKMYAKEVLGKLPVVQHFKFGKYLQFKKEEIH